jgi:tetratricopeptide (TPR) repeat protein
MMNSLLESLNFLRKRLHFYDGLIVLLVLSGTAYYSLVQLIGCRLLQVSKICGLSGTDELAPIFFIFGLAAALLLPFIFWRRTRSVPKFAEDELGILFAPDFDEEIENEVNRLFIHLRQEVKSYEIGIRFDIKRLPPNLSINSASEATRILRQASGVVAVWGTMEHQSSEQGRITGFSQISITFVHRPIQLHESRIKSILMSLVGRKFHVNDRTLIADRKIMARDIGLIVRNLMGIALLIDLKFQDAVKILGPLHASLQTLFPKKRSIQEKRFFLQVQSDLAYGLTMATSFHYNKFLSEDKIYEIPLPLLNAWLNNVDQAILLDPQNSFHYINKAIYLFLIGDIDGSIIAEKKAEKYAPRASSVQNLSLAFLYNFQGNFSLSRNQYRIGLAKKTSYDELMIAQCINFIRQSITNFPEKKQFLLALAVLELKRGSKEQGIIALEKLLTDPPILPELQGFVSEAKNLLVIAKSNEGNDMKN